MALVHILMLIYQNTGLSEYFYTKLIKDNINTNILFYETATISEANVILTNPYSKNHQWILINVGKINTRKYNFINFNEHDTVAITLLNDWRDTLYRFNLIYKILKLKSLTQNTIFLKHYPIDIRDFWNNVKKSNISWQEINVIFCYHRLNANYAEFTFMINEIYHYRQVKLIESFQYKNIYPNVLKILPRHYLCLIFDIEPPLSFKIEIKSTLFTLGGTATYITELFEKYFNLLFYSYDMRIFGNKEKPKGFNLFWTKYWAKIYIDQKRKAIPARMFIAQPK